MKKLFGVLALTFCVGAGFTFAATTITSVDQLPASCTKATDECNNVCTKYNGYRACTRMGCETKKTPVCTSTASDGSLISITLPGPSTIVSPTVTPVVNAPSTTAIPPVMCTMEYNPMCGSKQVQCITAPCPPITQTYGNLCMLNADKATFLYTGECSTGTVSTGVIGTGMMGTGMIVGNDSDEHGCKGSAGYSWSQSAKACVRVWEQDTTPLRKAFDFAFDHKITTMDSIIDFRSNDSITRQEAAKMLVAMAQNTYGKKITSIPEGCKSTYKDMNLFGSTLKSYITDACSLGLMKGANGYFNPNGNITKAQALAVIMRTVDGWKEETTNPRWKVYADRAHELGLVTFSDSDYQSFDQAITRGELIQWIQTIYENNNSQQ